MARPVGRWLETFMCGHYADTFESYGYKTLQSVCQLDYNQLQRMGVRQEHFDKIMENVSVLRQSYMGGPSSPPGYSNYPMYQPHGDMVNASGYAPRSYGAMPTNPMHQQPMLSPTYREQQEFHDGTFPSHQAFGQMAYYNKPGYSDASNQGNQNFMPTNIGCGDMPRQHAPGILPDGSSLTKPVHHHQRNNQPANPQLVADNILQMAAASCTSPTSSVVSREPNPYHQSNQISNSPFSGMSNRSDYSQQMRNVSSVHSPPMNNQTCDSPTDPGSILSSNSGHSTQRMEAPHQLSMLGSRLQSPSGLSGSSVRSPSGLSSVQSPSGLSTTSVQSPPVGHYSPAQSAHSQHSNYSSYSSPNPQPQYLDLDQQQNSAGKTISNALTDPSNPLMSLQKLVMLPESQVVDPKSVVNEATLSGYAEESTESKNVEDPGDVVKSEDHASYTSMCADGKHCSPSAATVKECSAASPGQGDSTLSVINKDMGSSNCSREYPGKKSIVLNGCNPNIPLSETDAAVNLERGNKITSCRKGDIADRNEDATLPNESSTSQTSKSMKLKKNMSMETKKFCRNAKATKQKCVDDVNESRENGTTGYNFKSSPADVIPMCDTPLKKKRKKKDRDKVIKKEGECVEEQLTDMKKIIPENCNKHSKEKDQNITKQLHVTGSKEGINNKPGNKATPTSADSLPVSKPILTTVPIRKNGLKKNSLLTKDIALMTDKQQSILIDKENKVNLDIKVGGGKDADKHFSDKDVNSLSISNLIDVELKPAVVDVVVNTVKRKFDSVISPSKDDRTINNIDFNGSQKGTGLEQESSKSEKSQAPGKGMPNKDKTKCKSSVDVFSFSDDEDSNRNSTRLKTCINKKSSKKSNGNGNQSMGNKMDALVVSLKDKAKRKKSVGTIHKSQGQSSSLTSGNRAIVSGIVVNSPIARKHMRTRSSNESSNDEKPPSKVYLSRNVISVQTNGSYTCSDKGCDSDTGMNFSIAIKKEPGGKEEFGPKKRPTKDDLDSPRHVPRILKHYSNPNKLNNHLDSTQKVSTPAFDGCVTVKKETPINSISGISHEDSSNERPKSKRRRKAANLPSVLDLELMAEEETSDEEFIPPVKKKALHSKKSLKPDAVTKDPIKSETILPNTFIKSEKKGKSQKKTEKAKKKPSAMLNADAEDEGTLRMKKALRITDEKKKKSSNLPDKGPVIRMKGEPKVINFKDSECDTAAKKRPVRHVPITHYKLHPAVPWRCTFCGIETCKNGLGDLFGPYYPDSYNPTSPTLKSPTLKSPNKFQMTSPSNAITSSNEFKGRRKRRPSETPGDTSPTRRLSAGSQPPETWLHESCAVWTSGLYIADGKLHGLDESLVIARQTTCSVCNKQGATLGCLTKGCCQKYHFLCARDQECFFNYTNFSMICTKHKIKQPVPSSNRIETS